MTEKTPEKTPKPQTPESDQNSLVYALSRIPVRLIAECFFDFKYRGLENIPRKGGFILAGIHQSHLDPIMYPLPIYREMHFFAKAELFRNPVLARVIRMLNAFPVRRGEADLGAMKEAIRRVKEGGGLLVFPEGTRSLTGEIKQFEPGIGLMVRRTGAPLIPAVINGTRQSWPKGAKVPSPMPVRIVYGRPLKVDGLKPEAIMEKLEQAIRALRAEVLEWK